MSENQLEPTAIPEPSIEPQLPVAAPEPIRRKAGRPPSGKSMTARMEQIRMTKNDLILARSKAKALNIPFAQYVREKLMKE